MYGSQTQFSQVRFTIIVPVVSHNNTRAGIHRTCVNGATLVYKPSLPVAPNLTRPRVRIGKRSIFRFILFYNFSNDDQKHGRIWNPPRGWSDPLLDDNNHCFKIKTKDIVSKIFFYSILNQWVTSRWCLGSSYLFASPIDHQNNTILSQSVLGHLSSMSRQRFLSVISFYMKSTSFSRRIRHLVIF